MREPTEEECRKAARACVDVAKIVYNLTHRALILALADEWLAKACEPTSSKTLH